MGPTWLEVSVEQTAATRLQPAGNERASLATLERLSRASVTIAARLLTVSNPTSLRALKDTWWRLGRAHPKRRGGATLQGQAERDTGADGSAEERERHGRPRQQREPRKRTFGPRERGSSTGPRRNVCGLGLLGGSDVRLG